jgi:aspartate kinase
LILEEATITNTPPKREHDVLVSTGEQITIAKLVMCLQKLGYSAISYTGWQLPIITNNTYGDAIIKSINTKKIFDSLSKKKIVVIAGFQGIDKDFNITTLGRGGSDTTAVAIASVLKAKQCDIYTDVDGVYSADPHIVKNALKFDKISYDKMLELANSGAKVLHNRCVEIAKCSNMPIYVKSTFKENSIRYVGL